jgi:hypothetical protein
MRCTGVVVTQMIKIALLKLQERCAHVQGTIETQLGRGVEMPEILAASGKVATDCAG